MARITIRNLDEELKALLRVVAASNGRSMAEEVRVILAKSLARQDKREELGSRIQNRFAEMGSADDVEFVDRH